MRWLFGTLGIVWGAQFLAFREWWTRLLTATKSGGAPEWFAHGFPYLAFAASIPWSIMMFTGWFGTL